MKHITQQSTFILLGILLVSSPLFGADKNGVIYKPQEFSTDVSKAPEIVGTWSGESGEKKIPGGGGFGHVKTRIVFRPDGTATTYFENESGEVSMSDFTWQFTENRLLLTGEKGRKAVLFLEGGKLTYIRAGSTVFMADVLTRK